MLLTLSIFLIVVAISIAIINPHSKFQIWAYSIIFPIAFCFVAGFVSYFIIGNGVQMGYYMGSFVGSNIVPLLISIATMYYFLKKKFDNKDNFKYPRGIIAAIIACALIGGAMAVFFYYAKKTTNEALEKYMEEKYGTEQDTTDLYNFEETTNYSE